MGKKTDNNGEPKTWEGKTCGDCAESEPYLRFETLTVQDRQPTMGICPHVTNRKVLLSENACKEHFKPRNR